ncbi:hypothetical protein M3699_21090 [Peribacillus simplex]|nr:hypothetical protein [Peribacillus simplex]MCM3676286.1 hypothetical protein [Peribacillus simplex]
MKKVEREINSFEVAVGGIEDIIVHDGVVKLYNRKVLILFSGENSGI